MGLYKHVRPKLNKIKKSTSSSSLSSTFLRFNPLISSVCNFRSTLLQQFPWLPLPSPPHSLPLPSIPTATTSFLYHRIACPIPLRKPPLSLLYKLPPPKGASTDFEIPFFEGEESEETAAFSPPERPEGFIPPPSFDDGPEESEEEIARAFEELYGPAYSGESYLGNDAYVMDSKVKKSTGFGSKDKKEKARDGFEERVVQVRRVTKVVKGGKQLHFRAVVVVGDKQGNVGVGVGKEKEVVTAVQKSAVNARRNIIAVPMTKYKTFPHRSEADYGAAKVTK